MRFEEALANIVAQNMKIVIDAYILVRILLAALCLPRIRRLNCSLL
jgi:hypothetical protein